eukprot:scaffold4365_cov70-Phaeocystis_antarctica.AAC.7
MIRGRARSARPERSGARVLSALEENAERHQSACHGDLPVQTRPDHRCLVQRTPRAALLGEDHRAEPRYPLHSRHDRRHVCGASTCGHVLAVVVTCGIT